VLEVRAAHRHPGTTAALPSVACIARFRSAFLPRDAQNIACDLRVISFQHDFAFPIKLCEQSHFAVIDWERRTAGWLPQHRRADRRDWFEVGRSRQAQPAAHTRGRASDPAAGQSFSHVAAPERQRSGKAAPSSRRRRRDSQPPDHLLRCPAGAKCAPLGRYVVDGRLSTSPVTVRVYPLRLVRART